MHKNRIDTPSQAARQVSNLSSDNANQAKQIGGEIVTQVKKLATEKPVVVVAAGLAIGVLTGFLLKRR